MYSAHKLASPLAHKSLISFEVLTRADNGKMAWFRNRHEMTKIADIFADVRTSDQNEEIIPLSLSLSSVSKKF
jgi:hypothetical protein